MKIQWLTNKFAENDTMQKFFTWTEEIRSDFNLYLAKVTDSKFFQLIHRHKKSVAAVLNIIWIAGCGYWLYHMMNMDVKPKEDMGLVVTDSRDALTLLFFGALGFVFVLFFIFFVVKFVYNMFHDGIESCFSIRWHSIVKPVSYLMILYFVFPFTGTIKAAGLTAYNQVAGLLDTSLQHDLVIEKQIPDDLEKKLSGLMKLIEKDGQE
ncbi:MAG: hypothetical protein AB1499_08435 [Nitrospirota bacterium]